ncbi:uncharacterized protein CLUP02_11801 [Colletotrichum lupini]|uniref:Uncharacterized protein n=1 Tax=Colletotrichum lupini TaxID=145971 RepID=A0A9Q8WK61_9PEZI|nr:uncharacterized protein CLUP02_11801 [Colletotrichum lupini]UQC86301.1 hypothetical protein CLUP02_11801 [Colletotrichum lupini]
MSLPSPSFKFCDCGLGSDKKILNCRCTDSTGTKQPSSLNLACPAEASRRLQLNLVRSNRVMGNPQGPEDWELIERYILYQRHFKSRHLARCTLCACPLHPAASIPDREQTGPRRRSQADLSKNDSDKLLPCLADCRDLANIPASSEAEIEEAVYNSPGSKCGPASWSWKASPGFCSLMRKWKLNFDAAGVVHPSPTDALKPQRIVVNSPRDIGSSPRPSFGIDLIAKAQTCSKYVGREPTSEAPNAM